MPALEEFKKVVNARLNLLEEDVAALKQGNREDNLLQQYQEQRDPIPQKKFFTDPEAAADKNLIAELDKKPAWTLTLEEIYKAFQDNNYYHLCNSKKKISIYGQLDSLTESTTNPATNKEIPAKIILKDSTGRKSRGIVWSKTIEALLAQLLQQHIVFNEVYFKPVKDQYLSKNFTIFETLNKAANRLERNQYEFYVNKCKISRVKLEGVLEQ